MTTTLQQPKLGLTFKEEILRIKRGKLLEEWSLDPSMSVIPASLPKFQQVKWPTRIHFCLLSKDEDGRTRHSILCEQAFEELEKIREKNDLVPIDIWTFDALLQMSTNVLPERLREHRRTYILFDGKFKGQFDFFNHLFLRENPQEGSETAFELGIKTDVSSFLTYDGFDVVAACIKREDIIT